VESDAEPAVRRALSSGAALEKMRAILEWQGGDPRVLTEYSRLPRAARRHTVSAATDGYVDGLQADLVGRASMALGAGRQRIEDLIDHGAGVLVVKKPGERVRAGDTILELLYNDDRGVADALALAQAAIRLSTEPIAPRPLVLGSVS
jgi:pyrimidine-nucleoside phosphorylase